MGGGGYSPPSPPPPGYATVHNYEAIWLDIISDLKNKYIVSVIYRHPSVTKINKFLLVFPSCLADISAGGKLFYAAGDIYINIDKSNGTINTAKEYLNILFSSGALPIITISTTGYKSYLILLSYR